MHEGSSIRFGIVGVGNAGKKHIAAISRVDGAEISALCDIDESVILGMDYPHLCTDIGDLLDLPDVDVVTICTPHHLHADMAKAVAAAHKHILVEKPMALSHEDAMSMVSEARTRGVQLFVVKQNRYNRPVVQITDALRRGILGVPILAQCNVFWNRDDAYYEDSAWRGYKDTERGTLYTQVSHFIDILLLWLGGIDYCSGIIARQLRDTEVEDCGEATLRFSSGAIGSLSWTMCATDGNLEGSITLIGTKGTVKVGGLYLNELETWRCVEPPMEIADVDAPNVYNGYQGSSSNHYKVIQDVVNVCRGNPGSPVITDGMAGSRVIAAIEQIYAGCNWSYH